MTIPPSIRIELGAEAFLEIENIIAHVPDARGVYCLFPRAGEPHPATSQNLRRRLRRVLKAFGHRLQAVECWPAPSKLDSLLLLYGITREQYPNDYMRRLKLRPPSFLVLLASDPYPRLAVSSRVSDAAEFAIGPFPSKAAAEAYQDKVLGLFQLRRCPGTLIPAPDHPGCIYGEMNQCLRPCQLAASQEEYASEAHRVREFLASNGRGMLRTLQNAREQAAERLDFEEAALIHKRSDRVQTAAALRDHVAAPIHHFRGVALTPGYEENECVLRPMWNGRWQDAVPICVARHEAAARSLDCEIRNRLARTVQSPDNAGDVVEHLAMFQRWYRSSYCDGEWYPATPGGEVDFRRIVRGISKHLSSRIGGAAPPSVSC